MNRVLFIPYLCVIEVHLVLEASKWMCQWFSTWSIRSDNCMFLNTYLGCVCWLVNCSFWIPRRKKKVLFQGCLSRIVWNSCGVVSMWAHVFLVIDEGVW